MIWFISLVSSTATTADDVPLLEFILYKTLTFILIHEKWLITALTQYIL
jgi:hypothetical protein